MKAIDFCMIIVILSAMVIGNLVIPNVTVGGIKSPSKKMEITQFLVGCVIMIILATLIWYNYDC